MNISELFWDNPPLFMLAVVIIISFLPSLFWRFIERNMTDEEKKARRIRAESYRKIEKSFEASKMRKNAIKDMEEEFKKADKHEKDL
jgi:hypothetical protein